MSPTLDRSLRHAAAACHLVSLIGIPIVLLFLAIAYATGLLYALSVAIVYVATQSGRSTFLVLISFVPLVVLAAEFIGLVAPQFVLLNHQKLHPFLANHVRATVNFQVSLIIYLGLTLLIAYAWNSMFSGDSSTQIYWWLLGIVPIAIVLFHLLFALVAAARALSGRSFRYPFALPWVR